MSTVVQLTPAELHAWERERKRFVLLDVREFHELQLVPALPSATHLPMREIRGRLLEIPRDAPVVVMCHLGGRSERVAGFLAASGFSEVYNLDGGIDAYAEQIDPSMTRY